MIEIYLMLAMPVVGILLGLYLSEFRPRVLDPAIIFTALFLLFYTQVYFVEELFFQNKIKTYILIDEEKYQDVKVFLVLYITIFWIGYLLTNSKKRVAYISTAPVNYVAINWALLIFVFVALLIYIQVTGGIGSFLTNHRERVYESQWSASSNQAFENYIRIFSGMIFLVAAVYGGYLQGKYKKEYGKSNWIFLLFPLPGTIVRIALISRAFLVFYIIYFVMSELIYRSSRFFYTKVTIVAVVTAWGGWAALSWRSESFAGGADIWAPLLVLSGTAFNGASSVLSSAAFFEGVRIDGFYRVLKELSPVPSFIFSDPYENNLTYLMFGVRSGSSYPMPFIGEAYYNLGWFALILAAVQGWWSRVVTLNIDFKLNSDGMKWIFIYSGTIYWFFYMHHSGLRSSTRILIWVFIAIILFKFFYARLPRSNDLKAT